MDKALFQIDVVRDGPGIAAHRPALEALVRMSADANVFYEPWMLLPAIETLLPQGLLMVLVWQIGGGLVGFIPLVFDRVVGGLPRLRLWKHRYCFLNTPLISRDHGPEVVGAFMDWVDSGKAPSRYFDLAGVAGDSVFARQLTRELPRRRHWSHFSVGHERAMYLPVPGAQAGGSHKHQKEMRRVERRLAERGRLDYQVMDDDASVSEWIERFLALEASGWKGLEGSALGAATDSRRFFTLAAIGARKQGVLQMLALELDGVPIAMKCNFLAGDGGFAFKIAYDERYAEFSPGVLLELFNMRYLKDECPQIRWMDSCARADHPMINRLWPDRRPITTFLLASGNPVMRAWVLYRAGRRSLGSLLRKRLHAKSHAY